MKIILFCILFGTVVSDLSLEWIKFKQDYNKQYPNAAEELERKQIFIDNVNRMRKFQQTYSDATFTMGINHLADRRIQELVSGTKSSLKSYPVSSKQSVEVKDFPESLDWRVKGVISPVHSQGLVGEIIAAIVSTELVETLKAIEAKNFIEGSISRVYDCCPQSIDVFECIRNMSGICKNSDYPTALKKCEPNQCKPFFTFDKINKLANNDETTMLAWMQESTLWAEVDAEKFAMYMGGIYDEPACSQTSIDHVLQIVGYGVEGGNPYWICKNSWGEDWGEKGYIRIARGKNMCAIATQVVQVANTKTSDARRSQTIIPMFFILMLTIVVQRISNYY
ncbi:hypothetical protein I4U23_015223 [Adineta vaga]|nr:hypothetical protein I4U23_015223 [Adineta vaga]